MKVLILYPWKSFWAMGEGSGVASFFRTARGYVDHGHQVRVVLPGDPGAPATPETYHGMTLVRVPLRWDPMAEPRGGAIGVLERLLRYVHYQGKTLPVARAAARSFAPDVVVALGPHPVPIARRVALERGVPNVTRLFGQALILHMDSSGRVRNRLRFHAAFPEVRAFRTPSAAWIVHDDGSRGDLVARHFGIPGERFHFWRDGIDLDPGTDRSLLPDRKQDLGIAPDRIVALCASRLSPEKNLERLLRSFSSLRHQAPDLDLAIAGEGPSRPSLERAVQGLDLARRVHFLGAFARAEMHRVYGAADLFVSVSDRTNMTNAVLEAMAARLPVVALDTGATSSVVRDGETGLLVSPGDRGRLEGAILRLAGSDALRRRLGEAARGLIEREFERVDERVAREVELVERVVRAHEARARASGGSPP